MPTILINGNELELPAGLRLNAIEAAARAGVEIPRYCYHAGLAVVGSCRMCLIEIGRRDAATGKITMEPKLVPGCNTLVTDGMVLVTESVKVQRARAMVEEGLLLRHPIDCPICDKAGECLLQDYYFRHGQDARRADLKPFTSRRRDLGDITLFVDRCILCTRCVRFTADVSGTRELMVIHRGVHEEIDVATGFPLHNNLSGNVVDLCPVGALADKDFLYQQRVWFMRPHAGVCTGCAVGCSIWVDENQDHVYRLRPRVNPQVNKWWMCNEGRYGYHHVHDPRRLTAPHVSPANGTRSVPDTLSWAGLPARLKDRLREAGRLAGVISPYLSVEEAYLLCKLLRTLDPQAMLVLGPVPVMGEDEHFPGFVIAAEKCPNRRGVEAILGHFTHRVDTLEQLLPALDQDAIRGVWVSGGYKTDWIDAATAERFQRLPLLVVQDLFPSPLMDLATYQLPAAAFAERDGSYVNRNDRLQTAAWAIRPPWGVRPEGELFWEMLDGRGLYDYRSVLDELAREILYFSAAVTPIPAVGLDLKMNLLAGTESQNPNA